MEQGTHGGLNTYDTWGDAYPAIEAATFPVVDDEWTTFADFCRQRGHHPPFDSQDISELARLFRSWHVSEWPHTDCTENNGSDDISALRGEFWNLHPEGIVELVADWRREVLCDTPMPFKTTKDADDWILEQHNQDHSGTRRSDVLEWEIDADESDSHDEQSTFYEVGANPALISLLDLSQWVSNVLGCSTRDATRYILMGYPPQLPPLRASTAISPAKGVDRISIILEVYRPFEVGKDQLWAEFTALREELDKGRRAQQWNPDDPKRLRLCLDTPTLTDEQRCRKWNSKFGKTESVAAFSQRLLRARTKLLSPR